MRYHLIRLPAREFYTNTMMSKIGLLSWQTCHQIYGNKFGWIKTYSMNNHNKQSVVDTLTLMIQEMEIIQKLHIDNVPMTVRKKSSFFTRTRKKGINL